MSGAKPALPSEWKESVGRSSHEDGQAVSQSVIKQYLDSHAKTKLNVSPEAKMERGNRSSVSALNPVI